VRAGPFGGVRIPPRTKIARKKKTRGEGHQGPHPKRKSAGKAGKGTVTPARPTVGRTEANGKGWRQEPCKVKSGDRRSRIKEGRREEDCRDLGIAREDC